MTPQEKSEYLMGKFRNENLMFEPETTEVSIHDAIFLVDEIIEEYENHVCDIGYDNDWEMWRHRQCYWKDVKKELKKRLGL